VYSCELSEKMQQRASNDFFSGTSGGVPLYDVLVRPAVEYGPIIVSTTCFCALLQQLVQYLSFKFSSTYRSLKHTEKVDWSVRCIALIHGIFACSFLLDVLYPDPELVELNWSEGTVVFHHYASTSKNYLIFPISIGYFLWDFLICLYYQWPGGYTLHAFFCAMVYYFALFPFEQYILLFFLVAFEQSTPWLHIRGFMQFTNTDHGPIYWFVGFMFVATFYLFRPILGTIVSYYWWIGIWELYQSGRYHSQFIIVWYMVTDVVLMALMFFWSYVIVTYQDEATDGLVTEDKKK